MMIRLTQDVYLKPEEVSAIETYKYCVDGGISGDSYWKEAGSVITLVNGRKIYVKDLKAQETYDKIFGPNRVDDLDIFAWCQCPYPNIMTAGNCSKCNKRAK